MQTQLSQTLLDTPEGAEADRILRSCVHCGFCNAACPTYRILGDELDGPRGRIYLIKQMLEGQAAGHSTRLHLDRCLTCRACETSCPSGVEYGRLLEIGRERIETALERPRSERLLRRLLRSIAPYENRVRWALRVAPFLRAVLPARLTAAIPERRRHVEDASWPAARHARRVLILNGCVQAASHPHIDRAAARLLDRHGISLVNVPGSGCCGALAHHLAAPRETREFMLRNIDAWWPHIEQGAEAVVATSSACSVMLADYGRLLANDPDYGDKARRIANLARDISTIMAEFAPPPDKRADLQRIAFHAPCTLQHGMHRHTAVETLLRQYGFDLVPVGDAHLCCGAAGAYAVLQPEISQRLRAEKLAALERSSPEVIATANIGCLIHLQAQASVPVKHWIELIEQQ